MKYKVGDKVKVHTKDWFEKNCYINNVIGSYTINSNSNSFVSDMTEFCGKEVIIDQIDTDSYNILEDKNRWNWEDWMFEDMNTATNTISNPNIVEDFAKLIDVELDEEFYDNRGSCRYKFIADSGLMVYDDSIEDWRVAAFSLTTVFEMIKEGKFIKKWTPKNGDIVYFPAFKWNDLYDYTEYSYDYEHDKKLLENGLYFRTKEEAIECAKKIIKQMKEG